jgi:hypothetical protein
MAWVRPTNSSHAGQQAKKAGERQVEASPVFLLFAGANKTQTPYPLW